MSMLSPVDLRSAAQKSTAIENLNELSRSPGWKVYAAWLEGQKTLNVQRMASMDVQPNELLRLAGQMNLIDTALTWPKMMVTQLQLQLEAQLKKEKTDAPQISP